MYSFYQTEQTYFVNGHRHKFTLILGYNKLLILIIDDIKVLIKVIQTITFEFLYRLHQTWIACTLTIWC